MRNILATIALLAGCQTTTHLNEPVRTELYVNCIMSGWPVSGCDCLEQGALDNGAPAYIKPGDQVAGKAFAEAANKAVPECREKTQELMKDGMAAPGSADEKADRFRALRNR